MQGSGLVQGTGLVYALAAGIEGAVTVVEGPIDPGSELEARRGLLRNVVAQVPPRPPRR